MRIYEFLEDIVITNEMRGYHSGQKDLSLRAYLNNKLIGYIDYVEYKDDVIINMIEIHDNYKRKGVGKKLIYRLQDMYPENEIEWGMLTDEGSMLYQSLEFIEIPIFNFKRYNKLKEKYDNLSDYLRSNWDKATDEQIQEYYKLQDIIEKIENSEKYNKKVKRIIKTH
jgi:GNAT superfamily N-acetyltransferase